MASLFGKHASSEHCSWMHAWPAPADTPSALPEQAQQRRIAELEARYDATARSLTQQGSALMAAQKRLSELQEELENNAGVAVNGRMRITLSSHKFDLAVPSSPKGPRMRCLLSYVHLLAPDLA